MKKHLTTKDADYYEMSKAIYIAQDAMDNFLLKFDEPKGTIPFKITVGDLYRYYDGEENIVEIKRTSGFPKDLEDQIIAELKDKIVFEVETLRPNFFKVDGYLDGEKIMTVKMGGDDVNEVGEYTKKYLDEDFVLVKVEEIDGEEYDYADSNDPIEPFYGYSPEEYSYMFEVEIIDVDTDEVIDTVYVEASEWEDAAEEVLQDIKERISFEVRKDPKVDGQFVVDIFLDEKLFKTIDELDGYDEGDALTTVKDLFNSKDIIDIKVYYNGQLAKDYDPDYNPFED